MKILLSVLLSVMFSTCAAGQWSAIQGRFACPGIDNSLACARQLERALGPDRVRRTQNDALRVTLDNGHARVLSELETTYVALELIESRRLLVIFEQLPEAGRFGWLDLRTGAYHRLPGYPLFAPQGNLVVMAEQDVAAGVVPNVLEIHRYQNGKMSLVHKVDTPDWGPAEVHWKSGNTLGFRKVTLQCEVDGVSTCPEFDLQRISGR